MRLIPAIITVVMVLAAAAAAQKAGERELKPRRLRQLSMAEALPPGCDTQTLVVKLLDEGGAAARAALEDLLVGIAGAEIEALIPLGEGRLAELRACGERRCGRRLADLSKLFRVRLPAAVDGAGVLAGIRALAVVETAYAQVPCAPCSISTPGGVPDFSGQQGYRGAAPGGVNASWAQTQAGGDGSGVTVADIEFSWNLCHQDLSAAGTGALLGPYWNSFATDHGTAVLGVIGANDDGAGITGMAPAATLRAVTGWRAGAPTDNVPAALALALANLQAGDVILIELGRGGPNWSAPNPPAGVGSQFGFLPLEYWAAELMVIQQAAALGIHVVEAAGNGAQNFQSTAPISGHATYGVLQPTAGAFQDSGAIVVGAGSSGPGAHFRMCFSNFGDRVGVYAWGEDVFSLGYGPTPPWQACGAPACSDPFPSANQNQWYTSCFAGTSSASAIVAGAVASIEGHHEAVHGQPLDPIAMRLLLRTSGTASGIPTTDMIGRQPDLQAQLGFVQAGPQPAHAYTGVSGSVRMGNFISAGRDVNGDGVPDLAISSTIQIGRVDIMDGRLGRNLMSWSGTQITVPQEKLGFSTALGQLNFDGNADIVIGAPGWNVGAAIGAGRVTAYSGSNGALLWSVNGSSLQGFEGLGGSVATIGDLNGDSREDVLIGASSAMGIGTVSGMSGLVGQVQVRSGSNGAPIWTLNGPFSGSVFGGAVASIPSIDGDSLDDILVGAHGSLQASAWSGASGTLLFTMSGGGSGDQFGSRVAAAGDINGDGVQDIMVSAPADATLGANTGRVDCFSGVNGAWITTWPGSAAGDNYGLSIAAVGDWNNDGTDDVLIGSPEISSGGAGRVEIVSGANGAVLQTYGGLFSYSRFGQAVAAAGDLNGDGRTDIAVGAPGVGPAGSNQGRAYSFLAPNPASAPATPSLVALPTSIGDCTGNAALLQITAGAANAGQPYLVGVGVTGSLPGTLLPGGAVLPLNIDALTLAVIPLYPNWPFTGFSGVLDGNGNATATLGGFLPGFLAPLVGTQFNLAALTLNLGFVSGPATVTIY